MAGPSRQRSTPPQDEIFSYNSNPLLLRAEDIHADPFVADAEKTQREAAS
jgi:hypothetical protein